MENILSSFEKEYNKLFQKIDPAIILDEEQRRAVLTDEDYCLVIAGAGAGKTTTMAAKVKYLVDKLNISPDDILLISFTNKAVEELKERINDKLGIPAKVTTFHAFGYDLLRRMSDNPPGVDISSYNILYKLFDQRIYQSGSLLRKLILFFGCYFDLPDTALGFANLEEYHSHKVEQDFETLKSSLGEYNRNVIDWRSRHVRTIRGEYLRSVQEVQIANFLYLNRIEYEYEKPYEYCIDGAHKPYTPDFSISQGENHCYIEHFGLTEDGRNSIYTPAQLSKYLKGIDFKRRLHERYNTPLITTYASYKDGRPFLEHLTEELAKNGFQPVVRDEQEVYRKLAATGKDKYIIRFILLTIEFLRRFKTNGYDGSEFQRLKSKTDNVRTQLFLDIAQEVFTIYQDDPIMKLVTVDDGGMGFAEERRLFYVALTRTKNRIYIITPVNKPSRFVLELVRDFGVESPPKLKMSGAYNAVNIGVRCPVCNFPLKRAFNKNIGLDLWMCTNEPEIYDFMTNDRKYMGDIFLCPECGDGYMIVKKSRDNENRFFGCTNHRPDGTGCNHVQLLTLI